MRDVKWQSVKTMAFFITPREDSWFKELELAEKKWRESGQSSKEMVGG